MFQIRTDLALETSEKCQEDKVEMKGVSVHTEKIPNDMVRTIVRVETENGAKQIRKPKGTYLTIEAANMMDEDEGYHREISKEIAKGLKEFLPLENKVLKVLVEWFLGSWRRQEWSLWK